MSFLAKLNLKTVKREQGIDPTTAKRNKLKAALQQQIELVKAQLAGSTYKATKKVWVKDDAGESVLREVPKRVKAWYFKQDGGWYVQARYGQKVLNLNAKNNSVFCQDLKDIPAIYEAFIKAADNGELDAAIVAATNTRKLAI